MIGLLIKDGKQPSPTCLNGAGMATGLPRVTSLEILV